MLADLDLAQLAVGIVSGLVQHLHKHGLGGKVAAAGRGQIAAPGQQLHGAVVDLFIAAHGAFGCGARLGKGGRVKNDKVVGAALFFKAGQKGKGILAHKVHVGKAVTLGVAAGHINGALADVGRRYAHSAALGSVHGKAAGVGKAVQHGKAVGQGCHCAAVIFLVQEKAGFLAVFKIHMVVNAVFADLSLTAGGVGLAGQLKPALILGQALFVAQGHIVALVNAANRLPIGAQHLG